MADPPQFSSSTQEQQLRNEIIRLNKMVQALMDRAERSTNVQGSAFSLFQTTIVLEEQVRQRTAQLEAALRENERITQELRLSEARFRGLVSQSLVGISIFEDDRFTYANRKCAEMFGYTVEEYLHLSPVDLAGDQDREAVAEQVRRRQTGELDRVDYSFRGRQKDGTPIDIECHSSVIDIGGKRVLVSLVLDVTERTRAACEMQALQEQLREQAVRDPLTGLYNRRYLGEFFDHEMTRATRRRTSISVVMSDIDHFKAVNDTHGHQAGDAVLKAFAGTMRDFYRSNDLCFRYGGEEFLAVLPEMDSEAAWKRTERLRMAIEGLPIAAGTSTIHVTASFGIATFPQDGKNIDALLMAADQTLYAAKHAGRNRVRSFQSGMAAHSN